MTVDCECRVCQGRGIIFDGVNAVLCSCRQERNLERRMRGAKLPPALSAQTFDAFDLRYYSRFQRDERGRSYYEGAATALRVARELVTSLVSDGCADGLMLCGEVGTGKTFLAACIANALLLKGKEVLFIVVPDFLDEIRATYDGREEVTEHDLVEHAKNTPLLILDDLGAHQYTEWARQKIYSLLNHRLNHRLPVVITTNLSLEGLEEHLGRRTASRIVQLCRTARLMTEVDVRLLKRREAQKALE